MAYNNDKIVLQKTMIANSSEGLDKLCNDFKAKNKVIASIPSQIHKPNDSILWISTLFYQE